MKTALYFFCGTLVLIFTNLAAQTGAQITANLNTATLNQLQAKKKDAEKLSSALTFFFDSTAAVYERALIAIPLKVANFKRIPGFQFSFALSDSVNFSIDTVLNVPGALTDIASFRISAHRFSVVWTDEQANGVDLADSTAILWVKIKINTTPGICTSIGFTDTPTEIFAILSDLSGVRPTTIDAKICTPNLLSIAGSVYRENGVTIKDVQLQCSTAPSSPYTTKANGTYVFNGLKPQQTIVVKPSRDINHLGGVNVLDMVLIQRHILSKDTFNSPYQWIAADVNKTGTISVADILNIRRLILGAAKTFPGNTSWRFVPQGYKFVNPLLESPLLKPFPDSIVLHQAYKDSFNADFIGIKVGDVNLSANAQLISGGGEMELNLLNKAFRKGDEFRVPIRTKNLADFAAFQMEALFDPNVLDLQKAIPGDLEGMDESSFGYEQIRNGILPILWVEPHAAKNIPDDVVLFTLLFKAKNSGKLNDHFWIASAHIPLMAVNRSGTATGVRTAVIELPK